MNSKSYSDIWRNPYMSGNPHFFTSFTNLRSERTGNYRYDIHVLDEVNISTKWCESSSHVTLIEEFISDISESGEGLELVFLGILRSESILRTVDEDAITRSKFLDIGRLPMIRLDESSCDSSLRMFEADTDDVVFWHRIW